MIQILGPNQCDKCGKIVTKLSEKLTNLSVCVCPGVVKVSLADMDRETRENYSVVIQAKDMGGQLGGLAGTTTVNITLSDINDNPPMFDQSKTTTSPCFRSRTTSCRSNICNNLSEPAEPATTYRTLDLDTHIK